jgi:hypothetical protein
MDDDTDEITELRRTFTNLDDAVRIPVLST